MKYSLFLPIFFILIIQVHGANENYNIEWKELTTATYPGGRIHQAMAYDSNNDKTILFGGNVDGTIEDITWVYDYTSNTWKNMDPQTSPRGVNYHAMAYDSKRDYTLLFGGVTGSPSTITSDTWIYSYATNNWTQLFPKTSPSGRRGHKLIYDSVYDRMILWGGIALQSGGGLAITNDMWEFSYDDMNWTRIDTLSSLNPSPRHTAAISLDTESNSIILYGGNEGYHKNHLYDTWSFDLETNQWTKLNTTVPGEMRGDFSMIYYSSIKKHILFGGYSEFSRSFNDEVWAFDTLDNIWTLLLKGNGPTPRSTDGSLVYSAKDQIMLLFGGGNASPGNFDTWSLNITTILDTTTSNSVSSSLTTTLTSASTSNITILSTTSTEISSTTDSLPGFMIMNVFVILLVKKKFRKYFKRS